MNLTVCSSLGLSTDGVGVLASTGPGALLPETAAAASPLAGGLLQCTTYSLLGHYGEISNA